MVPLYTCIGANDRIFDHCFCLSSAATTPLTLDPMGSPALLMSTQALSSNLTTLPSGRCHFFAVRTTTACRTSPRRTLLAALMETLLPVSGPKFRCFFTTTTMRSPACPVNLYPHCVTRPLSGGPPPSHLFHIPTLAGRFDRRTLTHSTIAAPELSMQLMSDWIVMHELLQCSVVANGGQTHL